MTKQQYQLWILEHQSDDYILERKNEDLIQLDTSYAVASVQFSSIEDNILAVSYTHLRAHETGRNLVCRLLLEKKKKRKKQWNPLFKSNC